MTLQKNVVADDTEFKRREWLLLITILLLVEYWITSISYEFSGSSEVINYISFAATISSILLAVIAIIYSFYQSDSQQKSAAIIANQIENLRSVSTEIDTSKVALEGQLSRISTVLDKVNDLKEIVTGANKQVSDRLEAVHKRFDNLMSKEDRTPQSPEKFNVELAAEIILRRSSFEADLFGYALAKYIKLDPKHQAEVPYFLQNHYAKPLTKSGIKSMVNESSLWSSGLVILSTLRAFNAINWVDEKITITSSRLQPVLEKIEKETLNVLPEGYDKALVEIDKSFSGLQNPD